MPPVAKPNVNCRCFVLALCLVAAAPSAPAQPASGIVNPAIDMGAFLRVASEAAMHRASRRLTEEEFIHMSRLPRTVILDARSKDKYDQMHIRGAMHLAFPDIAIDTLDRMIPDRSTRILIYCNNNFMNEQSAFPSKLPSASLNLSTFIALYDYGYRNVYELGPLIDIRATRLAMQTGQAAAAAGSDIAR